MCGIIARTGRDDGVEELLSGLQNLEYRGYDSAGIAVQNGHGIEICKREGEVSQLAAQLESRPPRGEVGIGHTRWSTHGAPSDQNAHPHTDCTSTVAVVHNGIIDNYDALKDRLIEEGHAFESETDTEVIPHLMESYLADGRSPAGAFWATVDELSGSYAIAAVVDGHDTVFATRKGSPLVLGIDDERLFLASDVPAFRQYTDEVVYLEDGDVVVARPTGYRVFDADGDAVDRERETVEWDVSDAGKSGYDHYMLKEIHEQPSALRQTIRGRVDPYDGGVDLDSFPPGTFEDVETVQFVGCGTSYHAAAYAARFVADEGIPASTYLAGEYASRPPPAGPETAVVAVTQSGETADTLDAIRRAEGSGARTVAVTNTAGSTATRVSDDSLLIRAGPEIGVAATKTFSSQVVALSLLGERLVRDVQGHPSTEARERLEAIADLPGDVQQVLDRTVATEIAADYVDSDAYFFIGREYGYPVALEGALKFKEITYEHAEGFAASELKHGPLALVTPETPVFAILTGRDDERTVSSINEVQARGAPVIAVTGEGGADVQRYSDAVLEIPRTHHHVAGVLANVQLQLVAYHTAELMDRSIDKPRNLAKSVTVA